jgi:hypothetical protein
MGMKVTNNGISVQFCQKDGSPDGLPFYGRYAGLFGQVRSDVLSASGVGATQDETMFQGSDDWLTLIAVADTPEKLDQILSETARIPQTPADTSGSSRRAQVELHIGGVRQSFANRLTIASGPILQFKPPKIHVVHVKVLPEGILLGDLGADHPLVAEFIGNSPLLE